MQQGGDARGVVSLGWFSALQSLFITDRYHQANSLMSDCLHCDINEIVQKHIDKTDTADVADLAARIAESLADTICTFVPEEDQANVLAHTIAHLGEMFLQKGGAAEGDTTH